MRNKVEINNHDLQMIKEHAHHLFTTEQFNSRLDSESQVSLAWTKAVLRELNKLGVSLNVSIVVGSKYDGSLEEF